MKALQAHWHRAEAKFAALSLRERTIVALALLAGGGMLFFNFGVEPALLKARNAARAAATARADMASQQAVLATIKSQSADPDAANRQRLEHLRQELAKVGGRLSSFEADMVPPARMQAFLERLLARNQSIELLGFRTLPVSLVGAPVPQSKSEAAPSPVAQINARIAEQANPEAVREKPTEAQATASQSEGIYQHGIEIRLAGSYNDLLNYLADIERMPQRLMWNSLSFTVERYPRNIMVLRVYTLSLDRNWMTV